MNATNVKKPSNTTPANTKESSKTVSKTANVTKPTSEKKAEPKKAEPKKAAVKKEVKVPSLKKEKALKPPKHKVNFKKSSTRDESVAYFQAIINGIKKGAIEFKQEEESIKLSPSQELSVEVKASSKGDKEKVTFKISWTKANAAESKLEIK